MCDDPGPEDPVGQEQGHGDDWEERQGQRHDAHRDAACSKRDATTTTFEARHLFTSHKRRTTTKNVLTKWIVFCDTFFFTDGSILEVGLAAS